MSSNNVVKSPTSSPSFPHSELAPLVLMRTCNRSGNAGASTVRVQKVELAPFCKVNGGVNSQLLIVLVPVPLLKLAAM